MVILEGKQGKLIQKEPGKVAHYSAFPHNVIGNQWYDISGNGYNGTIIGAIIDNNTMNLGGVNDYIDLGSGLTPIFNDDFTINLRVKFNDLSNEQWILGNYNNFSSSKWVMLWTRALDSTLAFGTDDASNNDIVEVETSNLSTGVFYSLTCVRDFTNGFLYFYIDGNLIDSTPILCAKDITSLYNFVIGKQSNAEAGYSNIAIKDIIVYNYAFTAQQALDYHNLF